MSNIGYANIINPNLLQSSSLDPISNPMSSNLDLGMNEIVNVAEGTQPNSAVNLGQVNEIVAASGGSGGSVTSFTGNATFDINMNGHDVTNVDKVTFNVNPNGNSNDTSALSCDTNGNLLSNGAQLITDQTITRYITPGFTGDIDLNDHNINNVQQIDFAGGSTNSLSTLNNNLVYNGNTVLTTQRNVTVAQTLDLISNVGSYSILLDATEPIYFTANNTDIQGSISLSGTNITMPASTDNGTIIFQNSISNGTIVSIDGISGAESDTTIGFSSSLQNARDGIYIYSLDLTYNDNPPGTWIYTMIRNSVNGEATGSPYLGATEFAIQYVNNILSCLVNGVVVAPLNISGTAFNDLELFVSLTLPQNTTLTNAKISAVSPSSQVGRVGSTIKPDITKSYNFELSTQFWTNQTFPLNNAIIPSNAQMDIFIYDAQFNNCINIGGEKPAWTFKNSAFKYDASLKTLSLSFTSNPTDGTNTDVTNNFYSGFNINTIGPWTYSFCFKLNNTPVLASDFTGILTIQSIETSPYDVPVLYYNDAQTSTSMIQVGSNSNQIMTLSSTGNLGIYGNFLSGSDFVGLGLQLPHSRVCNTADKDLIVTRDNGVTIGKIYDSVYNPPGPQIPNLAIGATGLEYEGYSVFTNASTQSPAQYNLVSTLGSAGSSIGSANANIPGGSPNYQEMCKVYTPNGNFASYFNEVTGFKFHMEIAIATGTFPFTYENPTTLLIKVQDNAGNSIINPAQDIFTFTNSGFVYDSVSQWLTFDYYIDSSTNDNLSFITKNYYNTNALTNINATSYFTFSFWMASFNGNVFPWANNIANSYVTLYTSDKTFNYPIASKTDGITTSINLGDNVPLLLATRENLSYNGTSLLQPINTSIGSISRTFTALPSTPDNFFIPVGVNTAGCVKITLVGHTFGSGEIFKGWGCFEVMCCYNNASTPSNYTGTALPYLNSATGQIINGSDVNGDANSCVFQASTVSMSTAYPNQISVFVSFHTSNVVYTAKYEITSCIGTP